MVHAFKRSINNDGITNNNEKIHENENEIQ